MSEAKPRLIIVAGSNGAVKTSITEQLLRTVDGRLHKQYGDINPWAREILNEIIQK